MAVAEIPLGVSQASGFEELADPSASPAVYNLLLDGSGALRPRPGVTYYYTTEAGAAVSVASPVIGAAIWRDSIIYVTEDRYIYAQTSPTSILSLSSSTATTQLDGSARPTFALLSDMVVIMGGGAPQKWTGVGLAARLSGSPPAGTHICSLGRRLVVAGLDPTGIFQWSGLGAYETWSAANVKEAEARPDKVVALYENIRELYAFGETTLQVYGIGSDSNDPFETLTALNIGCSAAHSPIQLDDSFAWLDERRRFVKSDGRGHAVLSVPIAKTLAGLATVSDCWGFRARIDAYDLYVWVFPTEKRAFCYQADAERWSEWRGFSSALGDWTTFPFNSYTYWPSKNLHLVGSPANGIAKLSTTTKTDLGAILNCEVRTGFLNHGSKKWKRAIRDSYTVRRGVGTFGGTESKFEVSHRDDLGPWGGWSQIGLGLGGDYNVEVEDFRAGIYKHRQMAMRYSATDDLSLAGATHEYEELAR